VAGVPEDPKHVPEQLADVIFTSSLFTLMFI
jgi:hypothetical protein